MNPLDDYLRKVGDLPTMPEIANQVLRAAEDPETTVSDLTAIVQVDPPIVARILKVANSALYGFPRQIETLGHAIALLGARSLRNLVLAISMRQLFTAFGNLERMLWEHSATAGPVAARLARETALELDSEEAFIAGLLHDIGKIALAVSHREEYLGVMEDLRKGRASIDAERDVFGFDHARLGARVASMWKLPRRLEDVIRHHHEPEAGDLDGPTRQMAALVDVTTAALTRLGIGRLEPATEIQLTHLESWRVLGLADDRLDDILELISEEAKKAAALLSAA